MINNHNNFIFPVLPTQSVRTSPCQSLMETKLRITPVDSEVIACSGCTGFQEETEHTGLQGEPGPPEPAALVQQTEQHTPLAFQWWEVAEPSPCPAFGALIWKEGNRNKMCNDE